MLERIQEIDERMIAVSDQEYGDIYINSYNIKDRRPSQLPEINNVVFDHKTQDNLYSIVAKQLMYSGKTLFKEK